MTKRRYRMWSISDRSCLGRLDLDFPCTMCETRVGLLTKQLMAADVVCYPYQPAPKSAMRFQCFIRSIPLDRVGALRVPKSGQTGHRDL